MNEKAKLKDEDILHEAGALGPLAAVDDNILVPLRQVAWWAYAEGQKDKQTDLASQVGPCPCEGCKDGPECELYHLRDRFCMKWAAYEGQQAQRAKGIQECEARIQKREAEMIRALRQRDVAGSMSAADFLQERLKGE